jgi:pyruvate formate lyase activating enzyme
MTLSGGEPMAQFEFTLDLLKKAKENNLHVCMETCGYAPLERYLEAAEYVDIFLFDYKISDPSDHKKYTGVSNELIISNLRALDSIGAKTVLRCPIIPGVNDNGEHFKKIGELASSLENIIEVNIEPYHPLGESKSEKLGKEYALSGTEFPSRENAEEWIKEISSYTDITVKRA